ncbi:6-bladed beta-propeller [Rhodohalobacter sp. SW132]|uniref:6-bladed beta-propeller n=1 Tax=Rhodohalobacter sp. SW132 TaxID=2293433 RepID=UPI000E232D42|nr:6-bladed beta-propeller [Rhodohalobacter sp. SW132]REL38029.1 6-bladed beta-propeller [Rhodohalobacter sp. SW132]
MIHKIQFLGIIGFVACIIISCTQEQHSPNHLSQDSFIQLPIETAFEFTESADMAFRYIRSMKIDDNGNVLVTDPTQPVVFTFDAEGNLIQKIGNNGQGPEEFQNVGSIILAQNSLLVTDGISLKIEVFDYRNEMYEHARTINVTKQNLLGNLLGLTEEGILIKNDILLSPSGMNNSSETPISFISRDGDILQDTLFKVPIHEFVVDDSQIPFVAGRIFGNTKQLAFDRESKVYSLWTENLDINYFTLDGEKHEAFSYSLQPVAITNAEQDSALNQWQNPQRTIMRQHMPDVKPVASKLVVDDQQRIWVELLSDELDHGWFAFTPSGEPQFYIEIPHHNAYLQDIRGNTVLWNYTDEDGNPSIVASTFELPEI